MRQTVDAEVKRAKSDSEIEVKELYYDIYEQVIHTLLLFASSKIYSIRHTEYKKVGGLPIC